MYHDSSFLFAPIDHFSGPGRVRVEAVWWRFLGMNDHREWKWRYIAMSVCIRYNGIWYVVIHGSIVTEPKITLGLLY